MAKLKIKVHESEISLLDSFEQLQTILAVADSQIGSRSKDFSFWADLLKIQKGDTPSDTPEDIKGSFLNMKRKVDSAFEQVISKLDAYI